MTPAPTSKPKTTTSKPNPTTSGVPVECDSASDCPSNKPWCCYENFCVAIPRECGDGECKSDADCPDDITDDGPYCCSRWGYCGTGPDYCETGKDNSEEDIKADPECVENEDCPEDSPWCCDEGYCAYSLRIVTTVNVQRMLIVKEDSVAQLGDTAK